MYRSLLAFVFVLVLALPALTQPQDDPASNHPVTLGKGPKDGELVPAWIFYWLLGGSTVVCGGLLFGLKTLWNKLDEERKAADIPGLTTEEHVMLKSISDTVSAKGEDDVPRVYSPRNLPAAIVLLTELAQKTIDKLAELGDARADRQTMREAFETEKTQMRGIYTAEIKDLQEKISEEQEGRRGETRDLWEKNDGTTREVMGVIRNMIIALENATKVIEAYHEAED